jgi:twitching motility two-component system response regulator PilH
MTATAAVTLGVLGGPASGASESRSVTGRTVHSMAKVMVVDDAKSELKLIEGILKTAGHEVVCFPDGEELEERVVLERPDLLLLDIVMPHRNGYEILRSLKRDERTRAMPVVLVSSKNQESDRVWGKRQGADEYLGKPFTAEQLVTVVRQFVR